MLTLSIDAANIPSDENSNLFNIVPFRGANNQSLCILLPARTDRAICGRLPFRVPLMPLPSGNRIHWSWSCRSTSANRSDISTHFLHSPTEECVTRLREGNVQLPVLQLGMMSDRVVLGFTSPSKMATLVSMSKSVLKLYSLTRLVFVGAIHWATLMDASAPARGLSHDTDLTACCEKGPMPTDSMMTTHPTNAASLHTIYVSSCKIQSSVLPP